MAKLIVKLDGDTYESPNDETITAEDYSESVYAIIGKCNHFKLTLAQGGFLVLGENAIQRAHLIFKD